MGEACQKSLVLLSVCTSYFQEKLLMLMENVKDDLIKESYSLNIKNPLMQNYSLDSKRAHFIDEHLAYSKVNDFRSQFCSFDDEAYSDKIN